MKPRPRKILVRGVNWLGDAVMSTPALCAVRESFPAAEITLLANPLVSQLFSPHPAVDRVQDDDRIVGHAQARLLAASVYLGR